MYTKNVHHALNLQLLVAIFVLEYGEVAGVWLTGLSRGRVLLRRSILESEIGRL